MGEKYLNWPYQKDLVLQLKKMSEILDNSFPEEIFPVEIDPSINMIQEVLESKVINPKIYDDKPKWAKKEYGTPGPPGNRDTSSKFKKRKKRK